MCTTVNFLLLKNAKKSFSDCCQSQKKEKNNKHNTEQMKREAHETEACKVFRIPSPPPSKPNILRISFGESESS